MSKFSYLGTPRKATDANGTIVWRWMSDAFGNTAANSDPDGDGQLVTINLRFSGQYFDAESGLHYNYFRYYNPRTGRYIAPDPIGLQGGLNAYAYVEGNPLGAVDVYGLNSCQVSVGCLQALQALGLVARGNAGAIARGAATTAASEAGISAAISAGVQYAFTGCVDWGLVAEDALWSALTGGILGGGNQLFMLAGKGGGAVDDYVYLFHGSKDFIGNKFDLALAIKNTRRGTPEAGIYLTDDVNRAITGYGKHGSIVRTKVPKSFAESIKQMGGPNKNQIEYFVNNLEGVDILNQFIEVKNWKDAFKLWQ